MLIYVKHLCAKYLRIRSFVLILEMKKYLYILLPILTFACGFLLRGFFVPKSDSEKQIVKTKTAPLIIKDTIVKVIETYKKSPIILEDEIDSLIGNDLDTGDSLDLLVDSLIYSDSLITLDEDSIQIGRDRILQSKTYKIQKKKRVMSRLDSLKDQGLNIREESFGAKMLVEFWDSPFNFTGYKLGKSKLVLYGINPESKIQIEELGKDSIRLHEDGVLFNFVKTQDFKPLVVVLKDSL